jgi:hypothetical protein
VVLAVRVRVPVLLPLPRHLPLELLELLLVRRQLPHKLSELRVRGPVLVLRGEAAGRRPRRLCQRVRLGVAQTELPPEPGVEEAACAEQGDHGDTARRRESGEGCCGGHRPHVSRRPRCAHTRTRRIRRAAEGQGVGVWGRRAVAVPREGRFVSKNRGCANFPLSPSFRRRLACAAPGHQKSGTMSGKSKAAMIAQLSKARRTGERLSEKVKVRTAAARALPCGPQQPARSRVDDPARCSRCGRWVRLAIINLGLRRGTPKGPSRPGP